MSVSPLIKAALTPGSIAFLVACLAIWLVLRFVWPGRTKVATAWLLIVTSAYVVLAVPFVAGAMAGGLPSVRVPDVQGAAGLDSLIVLDGDNRRGRLGQALRTYRSVRVAQVVVLGESWIEDELRVAGIPGDRISRDAGPETTRGQVEWVRRRMAEQYSRRVALVASRLQMPRVAALADAAGLTVLLVPSPIDDEPPTSGIWQFVPSYTGLRTSRDSLYEHAALKYYRWRGWIGQGRAR